MVATMLSPSTPTGSWPGYSAPHIAEPVGSGMLPVMLLACLAGTGGQADAHYWSARQVGYQPPSIQVHSRRPVPSTHTATPADRLNVIKTVLSPAMTELAAVFGISRQALYSWANGEKQPSEENAAKLEDLAQAAERLAAVGLSGSQVSKRKVIEGKTILQVAQAGGSASLAADRLIAILKDEADQRARLAARFANRKPSNVSADFDLPSPNDLG